MKIENTQDVESTAIKIVVAAEAGNGKTSLAATIENVINEKVLVISAEAGLLSLKGKNVDFVELQKKYNPETKAYDAVPKTARIAHLTEIFKYLALPETQAKYRWIFIDSLTEINQNMFEFLDTLEEFQGPKNTIKKYGELATRMTSLCKAFRDMPHYNVVFSALVKVVTDNDNKTQIKIDMTGSFADRLPSLFDEIFYLGVMAEVGEDERNLRQILTQKTDKITFPKDRSGKLARIEPANLGEIIQKIRAKPAILENISEKAKAAAAEVKAVQPVTQEQSAAQTQGA